MIKFSMSPTGTRYDATVKADADLPFLGIVIQTGIEIFLGMGVWKLCISRKRESNGDCSILGEAQVKPKPLRYSSLSNLKALFDEGYVPRKLEDKWVPNAAGIGHSIHGDVVQRVPKLGARSKDQTLVEMPEIRSDISINFLAFGMVDNLVGFFFKGATMCRVQISEEWMQTYFDLGLDSEGLKREVTSQGNYPPYTKVRDLL